MGIFEDEEIILGCFHTIVVAILLGFIFYYILGCIATIFLISLFINLVCIFFYEDVINYIIKIEDGKKFLIYFIFHTVIFSSIIAMFYFILNISWN